MHDAGLDAAVRVLRARDEIGRLMALYGQLLDDLRLEEWGELFTDDAIWRIPSVTFASREADVRWPPGSDPLSGIVLTPAR